MVTIRIFKAVWFVSLLVVLAALLYVYASLPESVVVGEDAGRELSVSRNAFFYAMVAVLAFVNVSVYMVNALRPKALELRSWFYGLIATFNVFFVIGLSFVSLYNSREVYDYARLEKVIYGSIFLFAIWGLGWPLYRGLKRLTGQSKVTH